jgi:acyl carrier protein
MATTQEIFAFLKDLVLNITDCDESDVRPDTCVEDLGLESMDLVELQLSVRKTYGVEVPVRAFAEGRLKTLGSISDYIWEQLVCKLAG